MDTSLDRRRTPDIPFASTESGLVMLRDGEEGVVEVPLTNFQAQIVREIIEDDGGAEQSRTFEIEADLAGEKRTIKVGAAEFGAMNWPTVKLGVNAVVHAGASTRDRARAAIQLLSDEVERISVFTHTGWRSVTGGGVAYLHALGGIGPDPLAENTRVRLPLALEAMALPEPPVSLADERSAVLASLRMLELGPATVMFSVLAAVYRAPMGSASFSIALVGPTGTFKTEAATLAQQHYGPAFRATNLVSWSSTENFLEEVAYVAKDALLVIDDFAPNGTGGEIARLHARAERVLRAQGNNSGRGRMRADLSIRAPRPPRGLILFTGEDVPLGQSLRARFLVLEVGPGDINPDVLTTCQADAASGSYARSLAGYLRWLSGRIESVQARHREEVAELRRMITTSSAHRRTPEIAANLELGFRSFLAYAREIEAITEEQAEGLMARCRQALLSAIDAQLDHQEGADPASRFLNLLRAALTSGRAHVAGIAGSAPEDPERWGWTARLGVLDTFGYPVLEPKGDLVGWIGEDGLYLEPDASFLVAQRLARDEGNPIAVGLRSLEKSLFEHKRLVRTEARGGVRRFQVRLTIQGARRPVLHLDPECLFGPRTPLAVPSGATNLGSVRIRPFDFEIKDTSAPAIPTPRDESPDSLGDGDVS